MSGLRFHACLFLILAGCASSSSLTREGDKLTQLMFQSDAGKHYRRAVQRSDDNPAALTGLASWYLRSNQPGKAELLLSAACAHPAAPPLSWSLYARLLTREGRFEASELALSHGLSRYPDDPILLSTKKELARSRIIREMQARLRAQPLDHAARRELALELLDAGWTTLGLAEALLLVNQGQADREFLVTLVNNLEQAKKTEYLPFWLERLLAIDYRNAQALKGLAAIALEREDFWKARSLITTYLMQYPNDTAMLEQGGRLAVRLGRHAEGKNWLEKAWQAGRQTHSLAETLGHVALNHDRDPLSAEHWFEKARQLLPEGDSLALSAQQRRLENQRLKNFLDYYGPDDHRLATILLRMAENHSQLGEQRAALELANRIIQIQPNHASGYLLRARAELALSRFERCRLSLERARKLAPDNPLVWWYTAELSAAQETPDTSTRLACLEKAAELAPNEARYAEALADFWLKEGKQKKALLWYQSVARLSGSKEALAKVKELERQLLEEKMSAAEHSARGDRDDLLETALRYRSLLGTGHPGYLRCLEAASQLDPKHAGLHVLTADAAIRLFFADMRHNLLLTARKHLASALRLEPDNTDALAVQAALRVWELEQPGDMEAIISKLTKLDLLTDPLHYQNLLETTRSASEVRAARWYLMGKILYSKNRDPAAVQYLEQALALPSTDSAGIAKALGEILRQQGNIEAAIRAYQRLLAVPNLPGYHEYAITSLIIGNLHAELARTFPRSVNELLQHWPLATNASACLAAAAEIRLKINQSLGQARFAYQSYIQRCTFDTHKARGQHMIQALANIPADETAAIRRIAALYLHEGKAHLARELLQLAVRDTRIQQQPVALRSLLGDLATLLTEEGQDAEAKAIWESIITRFPNDWRSHQGQARFLFAHGDIAATIQAFERATQLAPHDNDMLTALGFLYWKNKQADKAVQALTKSLSLVPGNLHTLYYLSRIELEEDKLPQAVSHGEELVSQFKQDMGRNYADLERREMLLDTLATLARASFRSGAIPKALAYVWEGIDLDKDDQFGFLALAGDIRILQKKPEEAEQLYARAVRADPGNILYRFKWAQAMSGCGKEEEAIRLLRQLQKNSDSFIRQHDVYLVLARVLSSHNRLEEAQRVLEELVARMPWLESGYIALGRHLGDVGQTREATQVLERGLEHIKRAAGIRDALAWQLAAQPQPDLVRARNLAVENVHLYPDSAEYRATLGYILLRLGLPESALHSATPERLQLDAPKRPPAAELGTSIEAAEVHFAAGRWDKALELIAAGEGSRALASSKRAGEAIFHLLLAKTTPAHELSPYQGSGVRH